MRGPASSGGNIRRTLARREVVPFLYRLGRQAASGLLTITGKAARPEIFVLRRGGVVIADGELAKRTTSARLARAASHEEVAVVFEGGLAAAPPGAQELVPLAIWARQHLEAQLDNSLAEHVTQKLAGARLAIRHELAPLPGDETDRRMLAAMALPRRLDQIWPLARTPRFRLLAFLYFLHSVDALDVAGVASLRPVPPPASDPRALAAKLLGVGSSDDRETVKRAYRRLARTIHPDLQPDIDAIRKRELERRFAEITAAYQILV